MDIRLEAVKKDTDILIEILKKAGGLENVKVEVLDWMFPNKAVEKKPQNTQVDKPGISGAPNVTDFL